MSKSLRLSGWAVVIGFAMAVILPAPRSAGSEETPATPGVVLSRLFTTERIDPEWFTDAFLRAVPAERVASIVDGLRQDHGRLVDVALDGDGQGTLTLDRATVPVRIALDAEGRIAGLWFGPPRAEGATVEDLAARLLDAAPGEAALLVEVGGDAMIERRADEPMAVGSAFKLLVLKLYEEEIADGALNRDAVVRLEAGGRSLPSGMLQDWPAGTPVTLETLAQLMIRISDNTATDALIRAVGRRELEALSPRNTPFLTTAAAFELKADEAARRRYLAADDAGQRAILAELAAEPLPDPAALAPESPPAIEWFFTTRELCGLMADVADAPALDGTSGPLAPEGWAETAFKGGSEPGVLNLTAAARRPDGTPVCVSFTANAAAPLPQDRLSLLFGSLFGALR